jgi:hypothetical protein
MPGGWSDCGEDEVGLDVNSGFGRDPLLQPIREAQGLK